MSEHQVTNDTLLQKSGLQSLENRSKLLFDKYMNDACKNSNEIIIELISEANNYDDEHQSRKTLLNLYNNSITN